MKTIMKLAVVLLLLGISSGVYAADGKVYYSVRTGGNWDEISTWSYSDQAFQPVSSVPSNIDEVYIKVPVNIRPESFANGKKVEAKSVHLNAAITINGGIPTFGELIGNNTMTLKGDYYPTVAQDNFTGMVALDGTFTLSNVIDHYQNLTLNIKSGIVTFNNANMKIGTLRITDGDAVISSNIEILEDLFVNSGRSITSTATITSYGNVENSGTATLNGDFKFASTDRNQNFILKGVTTFGKKIIVDKGTTDYYADFLAEQTGLFNIPSSNQNAINLVSGALVIGSNIEIEPISYGQAFNIPQNAELRIAGGSVTNLETISVEGVLSISSGDLTIGDQNHKNGVLLKGGDFNIDGGSTNIMVVKDFEGSNDNPTSIYSSAFRMQAGELTLTDNNTNNDVYFMLKDPNTVYALTGGTFTFKGSTFEIHSANPIATGGDFVFDSDKNPQLKYAAPFYTLYIKSGFVEFTPTDNSSLVVNGDFKVGKNATFKNSNKDLYIGGDLILDENMSEFSQISGLHFITDKNSELHTNGKSLQITGLYVDKQNNKSVILDQDLTIPGALTVSDGILDANGNNANGTKIKINVKGTVTNDGVIKGNIYLTYGGAGQEVSGTGSFDQLFQTASSNRVTLKSDITVNDYYFPEGEYASGLCFLNNYVLTINNEYHNISNSRYFVNNNNKVSSGLRLRVKAYTTDNVGKTVAIFPIAFGENQNTYAPATILIEKKLTANVDQFVTFNVVNETHPCLKENTQNASVYWIANTSNSNDNKGCFTYSLTCENNDIVNATGYFNVALVGVEWKESTYAKMTTKRTIEFCNNSYALPSGDFTAVKNKSNYNSMRVLYSSNTPTDITTIAVTDNSWYVKQNGALVSTNKAPQHGDILVVNGVDYVEFRKVQNKSNPRIGKVIFEPENNQDIGRLTFVETTNQYIGVISGVGNIEIQYDFYNTNSTWKLNDEADYSEFDSHDESVWTVYAGKRSGSNNYANTNKEWVLNVNHNGAFPNLHLGSFAPSKFSYGEDIEVRNTLNIRNNTGVFKVRHNIDCGYLDIGGYNGGTIEFQSGSSFVVNVRHNVGFDYDIPWTGNGSPSDGTRLFTISDGNPSDKKNRLVIGGDIVSTRKSKSNDFGFDLCNSKGDYVILEFAGDTDGKVDVKMSVDKFHFNVAQIVINKDEGKSFTFDDKAFSFGVDLSGATDSDKKNLVMKSGEAILNVAGQTITLSSGGADFVIPKAAKLTAKAQNINLKVTNCSTGITLGGALELYSGTKLINAGHFYYQETNKAKLTVNAGAEFSAQQFCPDPQSSGKITLTVATTSSNGSFKIGGDGCVSTTKYGIFDITDGSKIKMAANAEIHFLNGIPTNSVPDVKIYADDADCEFGAGSKLVFGSDMILKKNVTTFNTLQLKLYGNRYFVPTSQDPWKKLIEDKEIYFTGSETNTTSSDDRFPSGWGSFYEIDKLFPDVYFKDFVQTPNNWVQISINSKKKDSPDLNGGQYYDWYRNKTFDTYSYPEVTKRTYKYVGEDFVPSFTLASSTSLPNVDIQDNATVTLNTVALTVLNHLNLDGTLDANGKDMNLYGDFTNNGIFTANQNTVNFIGSKDQKANGNHVITFYNANITNTKGVEFTQADVITNELSIQNDAKLYDKGTSMPITVETKYTNKNGYYIGDGGIKLCSGEQDHLIWVYSTGHTRGLIVDNSTGVRVTNQNGENLNIDSALFINSGVLNMSATNLVLGEKLKNVETNASTDPDPIKRFNNTRMIVFESSNTTCGVKKIFAGDETQFIMPMGVTGKYTPAQVNISKIDQGSSMVIIPINVQHPNIIDDVEYADWDLKDKENALTFYWKVKSEGVTDFDGDLLFYNDISDYHEPDKYNGNQQKGYHYLAARLLNGKAKWDKSFDGIQTYEKGYTLFDRNHFLLKSDASISGDYTAGLGDKYGVGAIPGHVNVYVTTDDGEWTSKDNWAAVKVDENGEISFDSHGDVETTTTRWQAVVEGEHINYVSEPVVIPNDGPEPGSIVFIYHKMYLAGEDDNQRDVYRTYLLKKSNLDYSGEVDLNETNSHRFGAVSGTGKIITRSGDLPIGSYDDFIIPGSGTIEFAGDNKDYYLSMTTFNNVIFSGTGKRTLPSDVLIVNGSFTADGENANLQIINDNGATWNIHGDFVYNRGTFITPQGGSVSTIRMCGDKVQTFKSTCTDEGFVPPSLRINILEIDNSSHDGVIVHLPIDIVERVKFDQGVLNTFEEYRFAIDNFSENTSETVVGYTTSAFINGPLSKLILNKGSWTFPVGNHYNNSEKENNRLGEFTVYNYQPDSHTGSGFVKVRYYYKKHDESDAKYGAGIEIVDKTEYWTVEPADDATFGLKIRWDEKSNIGNTESALANVCITNFNFDNDQWEKLKSSAHSVGGTQRGIVTSVESNRRHYARVNNNPDYEPYVYTLAQTNAFTFDWKGSVSSDWFTAGNWSGGRVPSDGDFVVVGTIDANCHYPTINKSTELAEAGYLKLSNNSTLTIESRNKLTVFGGVMVDEGSNLVLKAATTTTSTTKESIAPSGSLIYYGDFSGKVTFQRYNRNRIWERLTVPVTGYNPALLSSVATPLYHYVEDMNFDESDYVGKEEEDNYQLLASSWESTSTVYPDKIGVPYLSFYRYSGNSGYLMSFVGTPLPNGSENFKVDLVCTSNDIPAFDGWNYVANPFLSAVDANNIKISGNCEQNIYLHNNVENKPITYNIESKTTAGVVTGGYNAQYIPAGQAFFVHATGKSSITFTKDSRSHGNESMVVKGKKQTDNIEKIVFNTSGKGEVFQSVVYFNDAATLDIDNKFDAYLQEATADNILNFYSYGSDIHLPLSVNGLPSSLKNGGEILLGYSTQTAGTYTLSVNQLTVDGTVVYLQDTEKGTIVPLSAGYSCQVDVEKGTNKRRFKLIFKPNTAPILTTQIDDVKILPNEELIYTIGTGIFADNDPCDYVVNTDIASADGSLLPSWLDYDYETGTFSGTPSYNDMGIYNITITASDTHGAKSSASFAIEVVNPANPKGAIGDIYTQSGNFVVSIPKNAFTGFLGESLSYEYALANGESLPLFINYNVNDGSIYCNTDKSQVLSLVLTVSDAYGNSLTVPFKITIDIPIVEPVPPIVEDPLIDDPIIEEPVVIDPIIEAPIIEEPIIEDPIIEDPIIEDPIIEEPIVIEPIIEDPIVIDPIIEEPIVIDPIIEDPIIEEPIVIDPIIEEPIVEQPIVEEPIIEEPIVEQPIVEEPIVEQPVVEQPIVEQPEVVTPEVQIPEVEDEVVIVPEVVIPEDEIGDEGTEEILVPEVVEPEPIAVVPERESFVESNEVLVYPVPSNGIVNVKLGSLLYETGSVDLTLVSASGRLVLKRTVYDSELEIDLTGHPGIYILRLSTPSATVVKRILIQ